MSQTIVLNSGFTYPLLLLVFAGARTTFLFIDVGGHMHHYIDNPVPRWGYNRMGDATAELQVIIRKFSHLGELKSVEMYQGTDDPTHLLRSGQLFRRASKTSYEFVRVEFSDSVTVE